MGREGEVEMGATPIENPKTPTTLERRQQPKMHGTIPYR